MHFFNNPSLDINDECIDADDGDDNAGGQCPEDGAQSKVLATSAWSCSPGDEEASPDDVTLVRMRYGHCYADPVTSRGKSMQMLRALGLVLLPLVLLLSLAAYWLTLNVATSHELARVCNYLEFSFLVFDFFSLLLLLLLLVSSK